MPDSAPIAALDDLRRLLRESNTRYLTLRLVAREQSMPQRRIASALGIAPKNAKTHLDGLQHDGFIAIDKTNGHPRYYPTPRGDELVTAVETAVDGPGAALLHHVLVCATRPHGSDGSEVRAEMAKAAITLLGGYGTFSYVGVYRDEPELVAELQGRIEAVGGEAAAFRASAVIGSAS